MTVAIDPQAARSVAHRISVVGGSLYDQAVSWRARLDDLDLAAHGAVCRRSIEEAAEELWRNAAFLALTADRATAADAGPLDATGLWHLASGVEGRNGWLASLREVVGISPTEGDIGEVFDGELRRPLQIVGRDPVQRARSLLTRLLADLSDPMQIRDDEFGVVQLAEDRFIVVLPGVTDLSRPGLSLSNRHRSVRDLDQYAIRSSRSSSVADNRYAALVWQALEERGVPGGSELMIVGHSFGADTALDLAADAGFNGARYDVTHVVAAGYYSQPQLRDVVDGTEVLVLQNHRDATVIIEGVAHSNAASSLTSRVAALGDAARLDLPGVAEHATEALRHDIGTMLDLGMFIWDHRDEAVGLAAGVASGNRWLVEGAAAELLALEPGVERSADHVIDVFEGGDDGFGHHPTNYIDHVAEVGHPEVVAFLDSLSARGYDADGAFVGVDISVPR